VNTLGAVRVIVNRPVAPLLRLTVAAPVAVPGGICKLI
jgi:hypothetical protein